MAADHLVCGQLYGNCSYIHSPAHCDHIGEPSEASKVRGVDLLGHPLPPPVRAIKLLNSRYEGFYFAGNRLLKKKE